MKKTIIKSFCLGIQKYQTNVFILLAITTVLAVFFFFPIRDLFSPILAVFSPKHKNDPENTDENEEDEVEEDSHKEDNNQDGNVNANNVKSKPVYPPLPPHIDRGPEIANERWRKYEKYPSVYEWIVNFKRQCLEDVFYQ